MAKTDVRKTDLTRHGFSGYAARPRQASGTGVVVILGVESVMVPFLKPGKAMARVFDWIRESCA